MTTYPKVGEIFELTLDGDAPKNDPMAMVQADGNSPEGWEYRGKKVEGKQTRRFKFVQVGYCLNWNELIKKLKARGEIPMGQWIQAFKAKYPEPNGNGPIGVPDSSWVDPSGLASFPYIDSGGHSGFRWTGSDFLGVWRWLVILF